MTPRLISCIILPALLWLTACGSYDFSVNDRVVYRPEPLFEDYAVPDPALRHCIEQAVASNSVSAASQLTSLNCSNAEISNLAGLSTFTGIEQLWLSHNKIVDLTELGSLTLLHTLYLDHNELGDAVPLYDLPALFFVDLSDNPDLQCPGSASLLRVNRVILPRHCR